MCVCLCVWVCVWISAFRSVFEPPRQLFSNMQSPTIVVICSICYFKGTGVPSLLRVMICLFESVNRKTHTYSQLVSISGWYVYVVVVAAVVAVVVVVAVAVAVVAVVAVVVVVVVVVAVAEAVAVAVAVAVVVVLLLLLLLVLLLLLLFGLVMSQRLSYIMHRNTETTPLGVQAGESLGITWG